MSASAHISRSHFGDHTIIHQGNVQGNVYYGKAPHSPARAEVVRVIPYPRNEDLVHRRDLINKLDKLLPQTASGSCSAALWGLGGSGKTQIALNYAYRRCDTDKECSIFWVHADTEATFLADYKTIGKKLGVDERLNGTDLLDAVRHKIEGQSKWLMILDNADELKLFGVGQQPGGNPTDGESQNFYKYVPCTPQGTILWTSRDGHIGGTLVGVTRSIQVRSLAIDEATTLLATTRGDLPMPDEMEIDNLLEELQCLPLAVSQAGAYMRRMSMTAEEYLSLLRQDKYRWEVLEVSDTDRHRRPEVSNSVLETWRISTERIRAESEISYRILHVITYVDSQDIPHELIAAAVDPFNNGSKDDQADKSFAMQVLELQVHTAVARLREFSFLTLRRTDNGGRNYGLHKLVREALQYGLRFNSPQDEAFYSGRALQVIENLVPISEPTSWARCKQYLKHAIRVAEYAGISKTEIETANMLEKVSQFLYHRGQWREKESVDTRAWGLRRQVLGEKHPDTIRSLAALGVTCFAQHQCIKAQDIATRALGFRQEILGTHPDTIRSMEDLRAMYLEQGKYDDAKRLQDESLRLRQEILGEKHPETIRNVADLWSIYYQQGQYDEAKKLKDNALHLQQQVLGDTHPDTIRSWADFGAIHHAQGQYIEAQDIARKVLKLREEMLGQEHLDTVMRMADSGVTYHAQDDALYIATKVLELRKEVLGEKDPNTMRAMADIGAIYYEQGQYDKAEELYTEALELQRVILGERHPDTIKSMANVVATYNQQGQYSKAFELHQTNLDLRRQVGALLLAILRCKVYASFLIPPTKGDKTARNEYADRMREYKIPHGLIIKLGQMDCAEATLQGGPPEQEAPGQTSTS
ncbi:hypothetical protein FIE12Z_5049 [Fusarium flagelliforme]|uniref:Uncharacterized protein n=1 Tax=Fusarium flagelliforme TaxID=2675880 RepID=A0A395MSW1_9HYPO|nr:hypothetical protein FIE12Z_5049 [Fusarium flagelliforme]